MTKILVRFVKFSMTRRGCFFLLSHSACHAGANFNFQFTTYNSKFTEKQMDCRENQRFLRNDCIYLKKRAANLCRPKIYTYITIIPTKIPNITKNAGNLLRYIRID